jgi:hypothetical protein
MIIVIPSIVRTLHFTCPWNTQYQLLPTHLRRIIGPCPTPPKLFQYIYSLTHIRSASDGSVIHNQGFQGWLFAKLDNEIIIQGFDATNGRLEDVSSYRADICGNIAAFTIITLIRKVYGFSPPTIEHVCDNKSAITATWKYENISVFDKTKLDADVAKVARNSIAALQPFSTIKPFWVEGHADKRGPPFSLQEGLNILTDGLETLAQTALPPDMRPHPDCLHFPEQQIYIVIRHNKVTSHLPYHISNAIHGPKLTKYLIDKENWPMSLYNSIAWDSLKIAFNKLTTARQIVTTKTMFSFWCTNLRHKRDHGQLKECNFCGDENEDWSHVLTCQGTGALIFRTGS